MIIDYIEIKNHVIKLRDFCFDLLFPISCLGCGKEGAWLCEECFAKINLSGEIIEGNEIINNDCFLDRLYVAADYNDKLVAKLIKTMKYKFVKDINKILAELIFKFIQTAETTGNLIDWENCLFVPVPLHQRRLRWRGFNQSAELSIHLANYFNVSMSDSLVRTKNNQPQAKLQAKERWSNIKDCFVVDAGIGLDGKTIFLIDDVATTGATLNECARALKIAGAKNIIGLVVARG